MPVSTVSDKRIKWMEGRIKWLEDRLGMYGKLNEMLCAQLQKHTQKIKQLKEDNL